MSNISKIDSLKRLYTVRELVEDGKSDTEIAEQLGMSLRTVQRNRKYLDDLSIADLTNKEIAQKREELYLELLSATEEIKSLFELYKTPKQCPVCNSIGAVTILNDRGEEIKSSCPLCFGSGLLHSPKDAKRFLDSWLEAIEMRAKLYGLDTMKVESLTQLNQFNQYNIQDHVDVESGKILSNMIKEQHEKKLKHIN
jgi:hypothetical protein